MIPRRILRRDDFRFELRPYDASCALGLHRAALESRAQVAPWMAWLHDAYALADAQEWAAHAVATWEAQTEYEFLVYDRDDDALAGSCGLNQQRAKDLVCNLGYWIRTSKTGLGAATQAAMLLREFGLGDLKLNRLEIVMAEGNEASRRVAVKAGAIYEGLQRRRVRVGDKVYDGHMYAFI